MEQLANHYRNLRQNYHSEVAAYMDDRYLRSPRLLGIETYVKCNATCEFCPYPGSDRIGQKASDELVHKIINDVAEADVHPESVIFARINEPLLDKRYFDFHDYAKKKMPTTGHRHISNGTTLTPKNVERIMSSDMVLSLQISLNSHEQEEHDHLMGIRFDVVVRNLEHFHAEYERLGLTWPVHLSRIGDQTVRDIEYMSWCTQHFPLFKPVVYPKFDWFGKITVGIDRSPSPTACRQFYDLHFLADGREAFLLHR